MVSRVTVLLALLCGQFCSATSHVWLYTGDGIWIASNSLLEHVEHNRPPIKRVSCKVVVSKNRVVMNAGEFANMDDLLREERRPSLSEMTIEQVGTRLMALMSSNYNLDAPHPLGMLALIEFRMAHFEGSEPRILRGVYLLELPKTPDAPRSISIESGIPYGVGLDDIIGMANHRAKTDPEYKDWLIKNPKLGLTQILDEEASKDPHDIGPPYTVFLLRPDGTVIDNSDDPKLTNCFIASDAKYVPSKSEGPKP
jgi:hypothetical protein